MDCPYCGGSSRVVDSRPISDGIRRRRECQQCEQRFTTHERLAPVELRVVKASGESEEFQAAKIERVVRRVTRDLGVSDQRVRQLVRHVEAQLSLLRGPTVSSRHLAALVLDQLEGLHPLAHHRLRANYTDPDGRLLPSPVGDLEEPDEVDQIALFGGREE
jgi:transcriptional repressor NrdR